MRHALGQPRRLFQPAHLAQKFIDIGQPLAADDALKADAPVVLEPQKTQQVELVLVARRKVGVAPLGRIRHMIAPVPDQHPLAQPGSSRNQRLVAHLAGVALAQCAELIGVQFGDTVTVGLQIVNQENVADLQALGQLAAVESPWQIGQPQPSLAHRPRHAEAGRRHFFRDDELPHDLFQPGVILRRKLLVARVFQLTIGKVVERQMHFRAAHIASQNHSSLSIKL